MAYKPLARKSKLVTQEAYDELLIYDLVSHKAHCLNATSAHVWRLCNGNNSVLDISNRMSSHLKKLVSEDLVWLALDQFQKDGLLSNGEMIEKHFAGVSRRKVIKQVGFASMVAIPIVTSLVAPVGSMAQTCFQNLVACTVNTQCCSNHCLGGAICCTPGVIANIPSFCQAPGSCNLPGGAPQFCCRTGTSDAGVPSPSCPVGQVLCTCD